MDIDKLTVVARKGNLFKWLLKVKVSMGELKMRQIETADDGEERVALT